MKSFFEKKHHSGAGIGGYRRNVMTTMLQTKLPVQHTDAHRSHVVNMCSLDCCPPTLKRAILRPPLSLLTSEPCTTLRERRAWVRKAKRLLDPNILWADLYLLLDKKNAATLRTGAWLRRNHAFTVRRDDGGCGGLHHSIHHWVPFVCERLLQEKHLLSRKKGLKKNCVGVVHFTFTTGSHTDTHNQTGQLHLPKRGLHRLHCCFSL